MRSSPTTPCSTSTTSLLLLLLLHHSTSTVSITVGSSSPLLVWAYECFDLPALEENKGIWWWQHARQRGGKHFAPAPSDSDPTAQSWGLLWPLCDVAEIWPLGRGRWCTDIHDTETFHVPRRTYCPLISVHLTVTFTFYNYITYTNLFIFIFFSFFCYENYTNYFLNFFLKTQSHKTNFSFLSTNSIHIIYIIYI